MRCANAVCYAMLCRLPVCNIGASRPSLSYCGCVLSTRITACLSAHNADNTTVRVVESTVKSDHKTIVVYQGQAHFQPLNKRRYHRMFRHRSPTQHARFLEYASTVNIELDDHGSTQSNFDNMYGILVDLLDRFYLEREITVTSGDPPYVTPAVKALLRCKNRLMRAGRTEEAGSIAARIRNTITRSSSRWLRQINTRKNAKDAWAKVREVIKGKANRVGEQVEGLTAQTLNTHYATISTDNGYSVPRLKLTAHEDLRRITEYDVFRMLDTLRPTATGLNLIQAWFLRLGAAIFAAPLLDCSTSHSHRAPYQTSGKLQSLRRFPRSRTAERLAADIDHAGLVAVATEVRRPEVYLSGPAPTASDARLQ